MSCSAYEFQALLSAAVGAKGNQRVLEENIMYLGFWLRKIVLMFR
jgi:hypothetical protein